jgi:hypothetical protein
MTIMALLSDVWLRLSMTIRPIKTRTLNDYDILPDKAPGGTLELEDCMVVPGALGLHDASGRPILESYQQRSATEQPDFPWGKPVSIEINPNDPVDRLEMAIALPPLGFQHFGHFMTDTAGWLSELLDPDTKLLELNQSGVPIIILGSGERSDLAALGIKRLFDPPADGILLAKEFIRPLLCRKILLPQPTMVDRRAMDIRQCQAYVSITSRWYGIDPLEMRQRMTHDIHGDGIPKEKMVLLNFEWAS